MTQQHPDLAAEQDFIDHAYRCLEVSRDAAWRMRNLHEGTLGGTFQARYERDVFDEAVVNRLTQLDLGNAALGVRSHRPDGARPPTALETFHIGRLAIADDESEPVVVDWRAPVAEPFYRATGREPMGLARRRHFAVHGRKLLGLGGRTVRRRPPRCRPRRGPRPSGEPARARLRAPRLQHAARGRSNAAAPVSSATSSPPSRPSRTRSSAARRPECWWCRAARAPARPSSPCTAPPTCSTPTASRSRTRACSSSGPTGCSCATSNRCCRRSARPASSRSCSAISCPTSTGRATASTRPIRRSPRGSRATSRMADVIDQAVTDRERPLRDDVVVPFRTGYLRLRADETQRIVRAAQRRFRRHNAARRWVESEIWSSMAAIVARRRHLSAARCARRCARCPRSARRSSGCGRCSRRRSCCTTCSAARRC